jgi:hypothetical protein
MENRRQVWHHCSLLMALKRERHSRHYREGQQRNYCHDWTYNRGGKKRSKKINYKWHTWIRQLRVIGKTCMKLGYSTIWRILSCETFRRDSRCPEVVIEVSKQVLSIDIRRYASSVSKLLMGNSAIFPFSFTFSFTFSFPLDGST